MEDAFGTLIWIVVGIAAVIAVFTLVGTGRSYREIGGGGPARPEEDAARAAAADRDEEIRQMLEAKSARRERRGEDPLDLDAELALLSGQAAHAPIDDGLRAEIRDHVLARNARRVRAGDEPLDVDAEIARRLGKLT